MGHVGGFVSNVRFYVLLEVTAVTTMEMTQGKGDLKVERWREISLWPRRKKVYPGQTSISGSIMPACTQQTPLTPLHTPHTPHYRMRRKGPFIQVLAALPRPLHLTPRRTRGPGHSKSGRKEQDWGPGHAAFLGMALVPEEELGWQLIGQWRERWGTGGQGGNMCGLYVRLFPVSLAHLFSCFSFFGEWNPVLYVNGVWKTHPSENVQKWNIDFHIARGCPLPER